MILLIVAIPFSSWKMYGKFTFDINSAMEEHQIRLNEEEYKRVAEHCEFSVMHTKYGYECDRPCIKHSLEGKDCVRKGCVDSGFLNLGYDCKWYVCEGYGDIKSQCLSYYHGTKEDYCNENPDDKWYCRF